MFGKEHLYIADGFTVLRTKVITAISSLPAEYVFIVTSFIHCGVRIRLTCCKVCNVYFSCYRQLEPIIPPSSATVAVSTNE
jgi:hypothetical protein